MCFQAIYHLLPAVCNFSRVHVAPTTASAAAAQQRQQHQLKTKLQPKASAWNSSSVRAQGVYFSTPQPLSSPDQKPNPLATSWRKQPAESHNHCWSLACPRVCLIYTLKLFRINHLNVAWFLDGLLASPECHLKCSTLMRRAHGASKRMPRIPRAVSTPDTSINQN